MSGRKRVSEEPVQTPSSEGHNDRELASKRTAPCMEPCESGAPETEPCKGDAPETEPCKGDAPETGPCKDDDDAPKTEPCKGDAPKTEPCKGDAPETGLADSDPQTNSKTSTRLSWCQSCWYNPDKDCTEQGHRVLSVGDALREAKEAVTNALHSLEQCQDRLARVVYAGEGIEIEAKVEEGEEYNIRVDGGAVTICLPHIDGGLTDEEKKTIVSALEGCRIDCYLPEHAPEDQRIADFRLDEVAMAPILKKLPACIVGQKFPRGSILFKEGEFCVFDRRDFAYTKDLYWSEVLLFGKVNDTQCLSAYVMEDCQWSKWTGKGPHTTEFGDVKLVDDDDADDQDDQ